jgi:hypothetical protein
MPASATNIYPTRKNIQAIFEAIPAKGFNRFFGAIFARACRCDG